MKKIFFTQRVEINESYGERRDAIDQEIPKLLCECGLLPIACPNDEKIVEEMLKELNPDGFFFSGGNSLVKYGGDAPERDAVETLLIERAIEQNLPLLGICRGCQFIADYFGGTLEKAEGHVRTTHKITGEITREVNSFHEYAITRIKKPLAIVSQAEDNTIEAVRHENLKITGIMWHPERGERCEEDLRLIGEVYSSSE